MKATGVFANLVVGDVEEAEGLYAGYLGLSTEEFTLSWVAC